MNRIQISQNTAELLIAGKQRHWTIPREDKVQAKKGRDHQQIIIGYTVCG